MKPIAAFLLFAIVSLMLGLAAGMDPVAWALAAGILIGVGATLVPAALIASAPRHAAGDDDGEPPRRRETPQVPPPAPAPQRAPRALTGAQPQVYVIDVPLAWRLPEEARDE